LDKINSNLKIQINKISNITIHTIINIVVIIKIIVIVTVRPIDTSTQIIQHCNSNLKLIENR
jgi:hypothetical protein